MKFKILPPSTLIERLIGTEAVDFITIGCTDLNGGWNGKPVFHRTDLSHHMLWGIAQGDLQAHHQETVLPIPQGSLLWIHGGCEAHFSFKPNCTRARVYFLRFDDGNDPPLSLADPLLIAPNQGAGLKTFADLVYLSNEQGMTDEPLHRFHQRCRLADLLTAIVRGNTLHESNRSEPTSSGLQPHRRQACLDYIHSHLTTFFRLEDVADAVRLNPAYLSRRFRQSFGLSLQAYVKRMRIEEGKRLLLSGSRSIGETAAALGYRDIYYFSRQFKEETGVSPQRWRREALG
ncbi:MAG: helix-turn-helix domain-containing protein [Planctomycetota bacterium]|jgi:AraC-like DNA-binding protein